MRVRAHVGDARGADVEAEVPRGDAVDAGRVDLAVEPVADPERLDEVERRLQLLKRLEAKYGRSADELIAYRATLDDQEQTLQQQEDDLAGITSAVAETYDQLRQVAAELSKGRQKAAKRLAAETQRQLVELGMAVGSSKAQLHRARSLLRTRLGETA